MTGSTHFFKKSNKESALVGLPSPDALQPLHQDWTAQSALKIGDAIFSEGTCTFVTNFQFARELQLAGLMI